MAFPYPEKIISEIMNINDYIKDEATSDTELTDLLNKVPGNKEAGLLCIYLIALHQVKQAACDHHSPDPDWMKILAIMWKHWPEFSTNKEGKRFL